MVLDRSGGTLSDLGFNYPFFPETIPVHVDDSGIMRQSVQQRYGQYRILEYLAPFAEVQIGGYHRAFCLIPHRQMPEQ